MQKDSCESGDPSESLHDADGTLLGSVQLGGTPSTENHRPADCSLMCRPPDALSVHSLIGRTRLSGRRTVPPRVTDIYRGTGPGERVGSVNE